MNIAGVRSWTQRFRQHMRVPARESELHISVQIHRGPPLVQVLVDPHSLKGGPDESSVVHRLCGRVTLAMQVDRHRDEVRPGWLLGGIVNRLNGGAVP
jgi:hypothetical protein